MDLTRAAQPLPEASIQLAEWSNVDGLVASQYAVLRISNTAGLFVHAFAPFQTIAQGTKDWNEIAQRFNLYCLLNFLSAEQTSNLTQTVRQLFTDTEEGRQIAASHSYLPCFSEPVTEPQTAAHPLPDSVVTAFENLSVSTTPPDPTALRLAKSWAESLYTEIKTRKDIWIAPHLTVQDGGDVVFEWWRGKKSLGVYVSSDEMWFLQSAGANSEQSEGDAGTAKVRQSIWQWLTQ